MNLPLDAHVWLWRVGSPARVPVRAAHQSLADSALLWSSVCVQMLRD